MRTSLNEDSFHLQSAKHLTGTRVRLAFRDGKEFDLDLGPDLHPLQGPLVDPLLDEKVFSKLRVDSGSLVFPTGLDYGADVLRMWCENGGVTDQKGTEELVIRFRSPMPAWSDAA
jgi:hypothetical protein